MGKITTEGSAARRVPPDRMILTLCFFQRSAEVDRSIRSAHEQCEAFLAALQAAGFPLEQVKLQNDELGRTYDENPGFVTNRTIELRTETDLSFATRVYEWIRRERCSAACNVRFELSDPEAVRRELLAEAYRDAREKAELLVELFDGCITGIDAIGGNAEAPMPRAMLCKGADNRMESSPNPLTDSLEAAELELHEHVSVTWLFS